MALREILAELGFTFTGTAAVDAAEKKVDGLLGKLSAATGINPFALAAAGIGALVRNTAKAADDIDTFSAKTGLSIDRFQELGFIAGQIGTDLSPAKLAGGVQYLNKALAGVGKGAKEFVKLGISGKDAAGNLKPIGDVLDETISKIVAIKDPAVRAARAERVFGDAGLELLTTFQGGSEEIAKLRDEFQRIGGGTSTRSVKALAELSHAEKLVEASAKGLWGEMAGHLAPLLTKAARWIGFLGGEFRGAADRSNILRVAALAVGGVLVAVAASSLAAWLPWIALALLVALVIDDVWTALDGGDSVVGKFIGQLTGSGAALEYLREAWAEGGTAAVAALIAVLAAAPAAIVSRLVAMMSSAVDSISESIGWWILLEGPIWVYRFQQWGGDLAAGIGAGIRANIASALDAVTQLGGQMRDKLKNILGIHSPSTVFAEIGANLDAGLAQGIRAGASGIDAASRSALLPSVGSGLAGPAGGPTAGQQVSIRNEFVIHATSADDARRGVTAGLGESTDDLLNALEAAT